MIPAVRNLLLAIGLSGAFAGTALAHHSGAAYESEHQITLEGTVKAVNWSNPHIIFDVYAEATNGQPAGIWTLEVSSPGVLTRSGWTKRSLQPGDKATFLISPLRVGGPAGYLTKATLANGQVLSYSMQPSEQ